VSTESYVREIIAEKLGIGLEKIIPQAEIIADLGADSLDRTELLMALEDEFDLDIPEEEAEKFKTVKHIVDYVESKV
jgi:acyl carrier protein